MKTAQPFSGFTLLEMMVVLAIIAVLCLVALPPQEPTFARKQVAESLELVEVFKKKITANYQSSGVLPENNQSAGIPKPEKLIGNFVDRVELQNGGFNLHFGNKAHPSLKGKTLSVRPIVVKGSSDSPLSWVCGYSPIPDGMESPANNLTDLEIKYLPVSCQM